ncbi:glycosyltransferase family 4 protein [Gilvibacter sediminis]|uniref:glycosyltransferase family 4 protein n=1 Tax=Gilvibacter sediminis TaxID=379071 RepID=UPI002350EA17|nr:glycosyltransferase family 1 protein [Gilvibacter sediminis]MDC7999130.1 glycosyltransferase family 1 protein [Gilvibacter sediminis]
MGKQPVYLVFRKANPGNFSIESIYRGLLNFWRQSKQTQFDFKTISLNHNFDLFNFVKYFLRSLFVRGQIIHVTGGVNYMIMAFPFQKRVLTIHDFYYLKAEKKSAVYRWLYYQLPLRYATKVVVVSKATKSDLQQLFPSATDKAVVINNPLTVPLAAPEIALNRTPSKPIHILQIGGKALKNYDRLLEACRELEVKLTLVHARPHGLEEKLKACGLTARARVLSTISSEQLQELYQQADLLYFASLEEGFGLPILEAQANGLPILTSNRSPMKDLAPEAFLVDPLDTAAIRAAILQFIKEGYSREKRVSAYERLDQFSYEHIAQQYSALYAEL